MLWNVLAVGLYGVGPLGLFGCVCVCCLAFFCCFALERVLALALGLRGFGAVMLSGLGTCFCMFCFGALELWDVLALGLWCFDAFWLCGSRALEH